MKIIKKTCDKKVKVKNYTSTKKFDLTSKYLKIKQNHTFQNKFFEFFYILYFVVQLVYNSKLEKKLKI